MKTTTNLAASIRRRLLNLSRERGEEFGLILTRYGLERLLYRLGSSGHRDEFVLKGAMLFEVWMRVAHRSTRDLDLLGRGDPSLERCTTIFRELCTSSVVADGLIFSAESVHAERIKEDQEYEGIRIKLLCNLENARIPLQIDVGFGDAVTPSPTTLDYPTLLDLPAPRLQAYPRESVVSEKLQAMIHLGMANSRMKDFFDLWLLSRRFDFEGAILATAIRATFERRQTSINSEDFIGLLHDLGRDPSKELQWRAFLRKSRIPETETWPTVVGALNGFLLLLLLANHATDPGVWLAGGPWKLLIVQ